MSPRPQRIPYSLAARELLRNTLLDAACHELQTRRWTDITMADIAVAAGVSRQTLYKEFGSREEFAQVLVLREAERFLDAVEHAVSAHLDDPAKALGAAFDLFLTAAAENPLLRAIVSEEGAEELLALLTTHGKPLVERAAERLTAVIIAGWPLIRTPRRRAAQRRARAPGDQLRGAAQRRARARPRLAVASLLEPYVEKLVGDGSELAALARRSARRGIALRATASPACGAPI